MPLAKPTRRAIEDDVIKTLGLDPRNGPYHFKRGTVINDFLNLALMLGIREQRRLRLKPPAGKRVLKKSSVTNLYRCVMDDGSKDFGYFIHAKIRGKQVRKKLNTTCFEVAKLRLRELHDNTRLMMERGASSIAIQGTKFEDIVAEYLRLDEENQELLPRTKQYHRECIATMYKTWPSLEKLPTRAITKFKCVEWAARLRARYSATRYNGVLQVMKAIFKIAVDHGLRIDNPIEGMKMARVGEKDILLPTTEQFTAIVKHLETPDANAGRRIISGSIIKFLAYSGIRMNEARQVTPEMIDFERKQFYLPREIVKGQKKGRAVPIIEEMNPVLEQLLQDYKRKYRKKTYPLIPFADIEKTLTTACRVVGARRITTHGLRHLFVTRCIESGVDVKTIGEWIGHRDGGALILKTYSHLRSEHSIAMAAKVSFL